MENQISTNQTDNRVVVPYDKGRKNITFYDTFVDINGDVIKYDDISLAESDLVKIVGRQYAAHALTACKRFTVVKKPAAVTT